MCRETNVLSRLILGIVYFILFFRGEIVKNPTNLLLTRKSWRRGGMLERRIDLNMFCPAVNSQGTASEQRSVCCLHLWLIPDVCRITLFCLRMVG